MTFEFHLSVIKPEIGEPQLQISGEQERGVSPKHLHSFVYPYTRFRRLLVVNFNENAPYKLEIVCLH